MNAPAPAIAAARALIDSLIRAGLRHLVLSPGSRSAPLVYAAHDAEARGRLRTWVRLDERSAAFLALGLCLADPTRPVAVATTSGTAAANLHPAVLEASHSSLPLVALTADRPAELHGVGANQTTDQRDLFGRAVRWSATLPAPGGRTPSGATGAPGGWADPAEPDARAPQAAGESAAIWARAAEQAAAAALGARSAWPGPVHLNLQFREPLVPALSATGPPGAAPPRPAAPIPPSAPSGHANQRPSQPGDSQTPTTDIAPAVRLAPGPATVVIAGAGAGPAARELAERAGWPLLAEPASGAWAGPNAITAHGLLLARPDLGGAIRRAVVYGRPTLSRPVTRLVSDPAVELIVIHPGGGPWFDLARRAARVAPAAMPPPAAWPEDAARLAAWRSAAAALDARIAALLARRAQEGGVMDGPLAARLIAQMDDAVPLLVAASNPIRDLALAPAPAAGRRIHASRGLAGIDGTVSTAAGLALGLGTPVRVLVGDLALVHDAGGLGAGALERRPDLQIVVLNDSGGGVFEGLEPGEPGEPGRAAVFERYFATPQAVDFEALARAPGARHSRAASPAELRNQLRAGTDGVSLIEVPARRTERRALAAQLESLAALV
ncbi:MAG: hypothetical protein LBT54_03920 [Bifidobacteriaceae bacterium]|jgi:2-succinyl-5-enolpyruvyl-6-hydroxy-3-cyclohexene-1-carboxylate synthase|nr:hypothetical protein [Bifidobacteriaceae bacterium]